MKTKIRREREFHQREAEFLDLARRLIADGGLSNFGMDRLAEATEYSKGTIYQHFASKEDLLAALAVQSMGRRTTWFERAVRFAGSTRERMYALTAAEEVFIRMQPLHFKSELMIKLDDFAERISPERRAELSQLEGRCCSLIIGVIEEAIRAGDLVLPAGRTVGHLLYGFVMQHIGTFTILQNFPQFFAMAGISEPLQAMRHQVSDYLDGLHWKPLSTESDPEAAYRRILQEVFADETRRAG